MFLAATKYGQNSGPRKSQLLLVNWSLPYNWRRFKHTNNGANTTAQMVVHLWQSTNTVILTPLQTLAIG